MENSEAGYRNKASTRTAESECWTKEMLANIEQDPEGKKATTQHRKSQLVKDGSPEWRAEWEQSWE